MFADVNNLGFQSVVQKYGIDTAMLGMSVVFLALVLITIFIAVLPKVLTKLESVLPPQESPSVAPAAPATDDAALAVAIGFALHARRTKQPGSK